jgi:hypothetical protein
MAASCALIPMLERLLLHHELTPYADDLMVAWPVSRRINTPKNNDAS